jgi:hypothetical protein
MTQEQKPDLRTLAEAVKGWSNCNQAWPHPDDSIAFVGGITDGEKYPVAEVDADTYGTDGESWKLAQFYAAANPAAVLALLDRVQELEAALKKANGQAEHFEREWYLRGDKLEDLQAQLTAQREPLTDEQIQQIDDETPFHESPGWNLRFARNVLAAAAKPQEAAT